MPPLKDTNLKGDAYERSVIERLKASDDPLCREAARLIELLRLCLSVDEHT